MTELEMLLDGLDEAFDRRSWHGANFRGSLRGVTAEQAGWRPAPGRHNIREVVWHASYWKYVVRRRLTGEKRASFPVSGSNWFERAEAPDEAGWKAELKLLAEMHRRLRETVAALPPGKLKPGAIHMIRGSAAHDLYHAGQIQLLKRLRSEAATSARG